MQWGCPHQFTSPQHASSLQLQSLPVSTSHLCPAAMQFPRPDHQSTALLQRARRLLTGRYAAMPTTCSLWRTPARRSSRRLGNPVPSTSASLQVRALVRAASKLSPRVHTACALSVPCTEQRHSLLFMARAFGLAAPSALTTLVCHAVTGSLVDISCCRAGARLPFKLAALDTCDTPCTQPAPSGTAPASLVRAIEMCAIEFGLVTDQPDRVWLAHPRRCICRRRCWMDECGTRQQHAQRRWARNAQLMLWQLLGV